jgi:hypothetical protein
LETLEQKLELNKINKADYLKLKRCETLNNKLDMFYSNWLNKQDSFYKWFCIFIASFFIE